MMAVVATSVGLDPGEARAADDTTRHPTKPGRGNGVAIPFEGYTDRNGNPLPIGGAVGVDLALGSLAGPYLPCKNKGDTFINACQVRGSYTTFTRFSAGHGLLFPHGYFLGNSQPDLAHGGQVMTGWGARAVALSVEFYPLTGQGSEYVQPRFEARQFDHHANGWTYAPAVGRIALVTLSDAGTTHFGGRLTDAGRPVAAGRVRITIFGGSARSSTGYPISSFNETASTGSATWDSGPMYAGGQRIDVVDTAQHRACVITRSYVGPAGATVDIDLSRPDFGNSGAVCGAP